MALQKGYLFQYFNVSSGAISPANGVSVDLKFDLYEDIAVLYHSYDNDLYDKRYLSVNNFYYQITEYTSRDAQDGTNMTRSVLKLQPLGRLQTRNGINSTPIGRVTGQTPTDHNKCGIDFDALRGIILNKSSLLNSAIWGVNSFCRNAIPCVRLECDNLPSGNFYSFNFTSQLIVQNTQLSPNVGSAVTVNDYQKNTKSPKTTVYVPLANGTDVRFSNPYGGGSDWLLSSERQHEVLGMFAAVASKATLVFLPNSGIVYPDETNSIKALQFDTTVTSGARISQWPYRIFNGNDASGRTRQSFVALEMDATHAYGWAFIIRGDYTSGSGVSNMVEQQISFQIEKPSTTNGTVSIFYGLSIFGQKIQLNSRNGNWPSLQCDSGGIKIKWSVFEEQYIPTTVNINISQLAQYYAIDRSNAALAAQQQADDDALQADFDLKQRQRQIISGAVESAAFSISRFSARSISGVVGAAAGAAVSLYNSDADYRAGQQLRAAKAKNKEQNLLEDAYNKKTSQRVISGVLDLVQAYEIYCYWCNLGFVAQWQLNSVEAYKFAKYVCENNIMEAVAANGNLVSPSYMVSALPIKFKFETIREDGGVSEAYLWGASWTVYE